MTDPKKQESKPEKEMATANVPLSKLATTLGMWPEKKRCKHGYEISKFDSTNTITNGAWIKELTIDLLLITQTKLAVQK